MDDFKHHDCYQLSLVLWCIICVVRATGETGSTTLLKPYADVKENTVEAIRAAVQNRPTIPEWCRRVEVRRTYTPEEEINAHYTYLYIRTHMYRTGKPYPQRRD